MIVCSTRSSPATHKGALDALAQGASPQVRDDDEGRYAIHIAVEEGMADVVRAMLDAGMPPDLGILREEATPLNVAANAESEQAPAIARMLIEAGADPNGLWPGEGTALCNALECEGEEEIVRQLLSILLDGDADVELPREDGFRPLMLAVSSGNLSFVDILLSAGADPLSTRPGHEDVTAWSIAEYHGATEMMARLELAGAASDLPRLTHEVRATWLEIAAIFEAHHALPLSDIIKGASGSAAAEIQEVEDLLGALIPSDVKAQWMMSGASNNLERWEYALCTLSHVKHQISRMRQVAREHDWDSRTPRELDASREQVQPVWWHTRWLPMATDSGGNLICIDLAPARGGVRGQVIYWEGESGPVGPIAPSWHEFLKSYITELTARDWTYDEDDGLCQD